MSEPTNINPILRIYFQTSRSSLQSDDRWVERLDIFVRKKDKGLRRIKLNILPPGSGSVEKGAWSMTMTKPVTMTTTTMMMTVNDNESKKMRDPFRREIDFPLSFPFSVCLCKRFLILCIAKENFSKVRVFFQPFNILLSGLWELQYLIISWQN